MCLTQKNMCWVTYDHLFIHVFYRHLNIVLIQFYLFLLLQSVLRFPALVLEFVETRNLTFIAMSGCYMMLDLGVGNLRTDFKHCYLHQPQMLSLEQFFLLFLFSVLRKFYVANLFHYYLF